jgi:two-component system sensor histidine kinase DctS
MWLWPALLALLVAAIALLVMLANRDRSAQMQKRVEGVAAAASLELSQTLNQDLQSVASLPVSLPSAEWRDRAEKLLLARPEILRLELRNAAGVVVEAVDTRTRAPLFGYSPRANANVDTELACAASARRGGPMYSASYFVPQGDAPGVQVFDLCMADRPGDKVAGYVVASYRLPGLLDSLAAQTTPPGYEIAMVELDGSRVAHGRRTIGAGVYKATSLLSLPGVAMQLQFDSAASRPSLIPDFVTGLAVALSVALLAVIGMLANDVRKLSSAEFALAEALAFRKAMEDSVVTCLRARDLDGRTTFVNPAFCEMVGFTASELIGRDPPPYWPPEDMAAYRERKESRMADPPQVQGKTSFETTFVRKNGERFPALVDEAPLYSDTHGLHGWMGAVLDLSAQRRIEELARQQRERLQSTARLATVGEMASLLSHELNQPLSAISAYATGSINMIDDAQDRSAQMALLPDLHNAIGRIAEQAERAGRVIKSVHNFVRRRDGAREAVRVDALLEAIQPLVKLQAQRGQTRIEVDICTPTPVLKCDPAMVEQVLLNLTRNGIQAMHDLPAGKDRVLRVKVRRTLAQWVEISVADNGPGIPEDVSKLLFTPFYTTRAEGMGLGLSVCRTIVEQHGGALVFSNRLAADGSVAGAEFTFTLAATA